MDVNDYRVDAEAFLSAIDREYYLHFAGLKDEYEIEPIYERHAGLFSRDSVDALREEDNHVLLKFAAEGYVEQAVKELSADLARLEASLEVELGRRPSCRRTSAIRRGGVRSSALATSSWRSISTPCSARRSTARASSSASWDGRACAR
jgi:hypothetical protein